MSRIPIRALMLASFVAALLLVPTAAFGESMYLENAGGVVAYGALYVDPYYATIGALTGQKVICDDFRDDSYVGERWTAEVYRWDGTLTSLTGTRMAHLNNDSGTLLQKYTEVAWLSQQLLNHLDGGDSQRYISFALWSVFLPTEVTSWLDARSVSAPERDKITGWLTLAAGVSPSSPNGQQALANITIYSPTNTPPTCGASTCASAPPQEFLVVTAGSPIPDAPEGSSVAILAFELAAVLGGVLLARKRVR
jgi:hypothetical protein